MTPDPARIYTNYKIYKSKCNIVVTQEESYKKIKKQHIGRKIKIPQ